MMWDIALDVAAIAAASYGAVAFIMWLADFMD